MKRVFLIVLIVTTFSIQIFGKQILDRAWDFKSSADVTFTIKDTLSVGIHFPNNIPDDRLIGYCRFHITVNDSNPGPAIKGNSFIYLFQFDSGFNSFDHILTLDVKYNSGLLANNLKKTNNYKMHMDPYPVSKIHQWFQASDSNFTIDTVACILRVVYDQKRLHKSSVNGLHKKMIASQGYTFDYGLFSDDSSTSIHFPMQYHTGKILNTSQPVRIFTINGKLTGNFSSVTDKNLHLNNGCFVYQLDQRGFRKIAKCTKMKNSTLF